MMNDSSPTTPPDSNGELSASHQIRQQFADLQATQNLLQATLDSSLDMIQVFQAVRDEQGQIIDFIWVLNNHTSAKVYGDVIGKRLLQLNSGVMDVDIFDTFKQVVETGLPDQHERHYVHEQFDGWFYQSTVKLGDGVATTTSNIIDRKKAEAETRRQKDEVAQRATDNYKSLFNSIDEGLSVLELIYDESGRPIDMRWVEVNPAFEKITGLKNVVGRLGSEVDTEQYWLDAYDSVIKTGESLHYENYHAGVNQWYRTHTSRVGGPGSRLVVNVFEDITDRKQQEQQQAFLLKLSDTFRTLSDEKAIEETGLSMLAELLKLDRAYVSVVYSVDDRAVVRAEHRNDSLASVLGEVRLADFPERVWPIEDQTLVFNDIDSDDRLSELDRTSLHAVNLQAFVWASVRKGEGNVFWSLAAATITPRMWTNDDVALIETVAERIWVAVEKAKAEEALRLSEQRLQRIVNVPRVGLLTFDQEGGMLHANDAFLEMVGYDRPEFDENQFTWRDLTPPEYIDASLQILKQLQETGRGGPYEKEYFRKDGSRAWLMFTAAELGDGTIAEFVIDISGRKEAEKALRQSEEKYRTIFNSIDEGFSVLDIQFDQNGEAYDVIIVDANPAQDRIDGVRALIGKRVREVLPDLEEKWIERYAAIAKSGVPQTFEEWSEATGRWYKVAASRVGGEDSTLVAIVYDDITERKQRELHQVFLLKLFDRLRLLTSRKIIEQTSVQLLGELLGLDRAYIPTLHPIEDRAVVRAEYRKEGLPSILGEVCLADIPEGIRQLEAKTLVVNDVAADPALSDSDKASLASLNLGALVSANVRKGNLVWAFVASTVVPRNWTKEEIALIETVAERTWVAIERVKAEEALKESEKRLRITIEAAELGTWEWNLETNQVYWNEQHFRLFGLEPRPNPIAPDEFFDHVHPAEKARLRSLLEQTITQRSIYDTEFLAVREDGTQRWMSGYGRVTEERDNQPIRLSGVMLDITERKTAQEALLKSEQELVQLQHLTLLSQTEALARMGSWEYHRQSGQFSWSAGIYRLTQVDTQRTLAPEIYQELALEADQAPARELVDYLRTGQGHFEGQLRIRVGDVIKTLRIKADVIGEGEATRVVGVDMDFTQQLLAQQQIRETAESLQAVLNGSPASIGLLKARRNETGQIVDFYLAVGNDRLAHFFDEPLAKLLGQPARRFSRLLWDGETLTRLQHIFTSGESFYEEKPLPAPHHDTWVALSVTRQDDGVVLTMLDITALKQAQIQQQHWLSELEASRHSVEALSQLKLALQHRSESLRAVSHDLKSNFGIITGSLSLLELAESEAEREQFVGMALRNVQQATGLLGELLDLTRLETGEQALRLGTRDVSSLFRELGENLTPLAQQQGLVLEITGPDQLEVETDELLLYRLVQNLAMNALKYTQQGRVVVAWGREPEGEQWWFVVEDTGSGLAVHLVERLNAPFSPQTDPAEPDPTRTIGSTESSAKESWASLRGEGIGLRIVREISHLLQARLQVSSQEETGTRFVVELPLIYSMS